MTVARVSDLPDPVTASKADWLVSTHWLGFTPQGKGGDASEKCESAIVRQAAGGYVLEYISQKFNTPNPGFETSKLYLEERERHARYAGRLVAIHRLRASWLPLKRVLGDEEFERIQDMWSENADRNRWSVAFPIVESYDIEGTPLARDVFGPAAMQRIYAHQSATLRPLQHDEQAMLATLRIERRPTRGDLIGIDADFAKAEGSEILARFSKLMDEDLGKTAPEGQAAEHWKRIRKRAAWLAQRFASHRSRSGTLRCDKCPFDPTARLAGTGANPRSALDVHHKDPLAEGVRLTGFTDFELLCPTCHRVEHLIMKAGAPRSAGPTPGVQPGG